MKLFHTSNRGKREELERRISDAADGLLVSSEIKKLEEELDGYPDLLRDYMNILSMPDFNVAYNRPQDFRNDLHIKYIKKLVQDEVNRIRSFEEVTIKWFKKYALAASFVIFGMMSLSHYLPQFNSNTEDEMNMTDYVYPQEESDTEVYVTYLDDLIE
ncbi:MAG: hypothetical protein WD267_02850 [Balneolales bacterium]